MSTYATRAELVQVGVNADALAGIADGDLDKALEDASSVADGYLASRYVLPLLAPYPGDLKLRVCQVAAYLALAARGFSPDANSTVRMGYEDGIRWFRDVAGNHVQPQVTDSRPSSANKPPRIVSKTPRGW